jgi:protease-4
MSEDKWTSGNDTPQEPESISTDKWERDLLHRLAFAALNEQRRTRRWGIFFKLLIFVYLFGILLLAQMKGPTEIVHGEHTALVKLDGIIAPDADASAENIMTGLRDAFEAKQSRAVILQINSPGGSPVQAGYINDEIRRLREKYPDKPLYAVVEDVCASGGYFVAVAADKIFVDKASIIGSIGVRMDSFGFVDAMDKVGVERRLLTAGDHKGFLDPFLPTKKDDVEHVQTLLDDIHQQFIDRVKSGRGDRLKLDTPNLFSGLIWTGDQGVAMGLADGYGSSDYVAREVVGAEEIVDYTPQPNFLEQFTKGVGVSMGHAFKALMDGEVALR